MSIPPEKLDVALYLNRIKYQKSIAISESGLYELQKCHMLNVPFENLDILNGVPIKLNVAAFTNKILHQNRGGFCYELNGLFFELLNSLGYKAIMISGRVFGENNTFGDEFDHMAILVEIEDEDYISDVGFGEFAMGPLKIIEGLEQEDERGLFKIDRYDQKYLRVSKKVDEEWLPQYLFTKVKRKLEDFEGMCSYHQTSPESHFTEKKLISIATESGRITLSSDTLTIKEMGVETKTVVKDEDHFQILYQTNFL